MTPQPGDVVILDFKYPGAEPGALAVIDGSHYGMNFDDGKGPIVLAVVNGSAFRGPSVSHADPSKDGPEHVSVSGGPCPFVPIDQMFPCGTIKQRFWRWKDFPRKDGGVEYVREVNLWGWKGPQS